MRDHGSTDTLTIVIPAYNEEEAVGDTIARCLAARDTIKQDAGLGAIEIIVVSDGSTDRTVEIARSFDEVQVIEFAHNRGYGAAIKAGFAQGGGTVVGFLDADGTCDPQTFAPLCRVLIDEHADVVLGSRMGPQARMPVIRRLGNRIFGLMLGFLCGRKITDTASGMRVIRRSSLDYMYPLPNGLHFTPSMSARALLGGLQLIEIPMAYEERVGESKLRIFSDGLRFTRTIIGGVLCCRPERLFMIGFVVCLLFGLLLAAYPIEYYWQHREVQEWMIYRFIVCFLVGAAGFLLLCGVALAHRLARLAARRRRYHEPFWPALIARCFEGKVLAAYTGVTTLAGIALLWPGLTEYLTTGKATLHWSRVLVAAFFLLSAFQALITGVFLRIVALWEEQRDLPPVSPAKSFALDDPVEVTVVRDENEAGVARSTSTTA